MIRNKKGQFVKGVVPRNKIGLTKTCLWCGNLMQIKPSAYKRRKCCCRLCLHQYTHKMATQLNIRDKIRNYPELRFNIDNGRALCVKCHKNTPNYGFHAVLEIGGGVHEFRS